MNPDAPFDRSDTEAPPTELRGPNPDAYPTDLADLVLTRWHEATAAGRIHLPPPATATLANLLSICYQATLLREEGRPVTFRLALSEPAAFEPSVGPPTGLHRLVFTRSLPLDQHELRRLAPAVEFSRSLIGATAAGGEPRIWGVIHSGPQWLQSVRGGRGTEQTIPPVLTVAATGPGRLMVTAGAVTLAELRNGTLSGRAVDVFEAQWLHARLSDVGRLTYAAHMRDREQAGGPRAEIHPTFGAVLAGHVLRRIVATIRAAQHGGTLIIVPSGRVPELLLDGRYMRVKYGFTEEEPRRRILTLMGHIMNDLAKGEAGGKVVGWSAYEASRSQQLSQLDEALFEVAHLVADLTRVDGTVIMTDCLEILGFGVEIAGELPEVRRVARAQDLEGVEREWVRTDRVGTRHRSAYRLCQAVHDALALVVSQDGGLRFIRWHDDGVAYWEQVGTGLWDV
jgi:Probable sensor domain DACNV